MLRNTRKAYTLAELLVALLIMGQIATFTIPKVLQTQQNVHFKAIGKEAAGIISEAYMAYKVKNTVTASTKPGDLTPFLNYIKQDTSTVIDKGPTFWAFTCNSTQPCYKLHNGAMLVTWNDGCFGGTTNSHIISFSLDPDGQYSGTTDGPGKSLGLVLYYNGRVTSYATIDANSKTDWQCNGSVETENPDPAQEPSWFSWN